MNIVIVIASCGTKLSAFLFTALLKEKYTFYSNLYNAKYVYKKKQYNKSNLSFTVISPATRPKDENTYLLSNYTVTNHNEC